MYSYELSKSDIFFDDNTLLLNWELKILEISYIPSNPMNFIPLLIKYVNKSISLSFMDLFTYFITRREIFANKCSFYYTGLFTGFLVLAKEKGGM